MNPDEWDDDEWLDPDDENAWDAEPEVDPPLSPDEQLTEFFAAHALYDDPSLMPTLDPEQRAREVLSRSNWNIGYDDDWLDGIRETLSRQEFIDNCRQMLIMRGDALMPENFDHAVDQYGTQARQAMIWTAAPSTPEKRDQVRERWLQAGRILIDTLDEIDGIHMYRAGAQAFAMMAAPLREQIERFHAYHEGEEADDVYQHQSDYITELHQTYQRMLTELQEATEQYDIMTLAAAWDGCTNSCREIIDSMGGSMLLGAGEEEASDFLNDLNTLVEQHIEANHHFLPLIIRTHVMAHHEDGMAMLMPEDREKHSHVVARALIHPKDLEVVADYMQSIGALEGQRIDVDIEPGADSAEIEDTAQGISGQVRLVPMDETYWAVDADESEMRPPFLLEVSKPELLLNGALGFTLSDNQQHRTSSRSMFLAQLERYRHPEETSTKAAYMDGLADLAAMTEYFMDMGGRDSGGPDAESDGDDPVMSLF